jgi:polysaccharide export outer membrane protein
MKRTFTFLVYFVFTIEALTFLSSCANTEKLLYFRNVPRDSVTSIQERTFQTVITKNDILSVSILTIDETNARLLNGGTMSSNGTGSIGSATQLQSNTPGLTNGYLVDESGVIKLPLLGEIKAAGMTKTQLAALITNQLKERKISNDAIVTVRILNYKITVLGEVGRPGVYPVPNEKITLPEAIAEAGDLTPYGKRDNVLLIREKDNKRIYIRFSLNNDELFNKDIYYLQNQDIIYVEPNSAKAATVDRTAQLTPVILSVVSLLILIYSVFKK